jgi:hypothetical protein
MSDQPPEQAAHHPPHYRLPADHLFTPQVEFWEIVCYRADVAGGPFTLRCGDMMGLFSQPTFARAWREASRGPAPPLVAVEEEGEQRYVLRAQAEGWPDETLHKMRAYLERGWIGQLGRHRHAKWVLNYLLLERQRRMEKTGPRPRTPLPAADRFSLSWMKLKRALEAAKGKKVEYRKLKDGFLLLERLGIVTSLTGQPTARLGYAQRFQHHLNAHRLLDVSPRLLRRCQPVEGDPLTLAQAIRHILRFLTHDYSQRKQVRAWPLDWLHGEVEVDLETEYHRRVPVRRALTWAAVGVLAQGGILRAERAGYALTPMGIEKSRDLTRLETEAMTALDRVQRGAEEPSALTPQQAAQLGRLLAPCRQRDARRAELAQTIVLLMNYPPEMALPLFALLRRRIDRLPEEQFPALVAHFASRQARGGFSLHPADVLDDFVRSHGRAGRSRGRRGQRRTARKTLKGRRKVVRGQLDLSMAPAQIRRARLYCTLRHGRPLLPNLAGQPLSICLSANDCELYRATVPLLDIPDDPLAPADITAPLRALAGNPPLTLRLTLPARLPALRLLARIELIA